MKYRVIGWTEYDGADIPAVKPTPAAVRAILADIREHHYLFTGYDHQESPLCAPVLNDGKKRLFSARELAALMAEAQGDPTGLSYARYLLPRWRRLTRRHRLPEGARRVAPGTPGEEGIDEEITLAATPELLAAAGTGSLTLPEEGLTSLEAGDTLTLVTEGASVSYPVLGVVRRRDLDEEEEIALMALSYSRSRKKQKEADARYAAAPFVLDVTLDTEK
ncbi:MAG: hypothetical protein J6V07_02855 [Clostridia bacterium]|nr:hypothetical protein [Clostridia bacterium]